MQLAEVLRKTTLRLKRTPTISTPELDTELIVGKILKLTRSQLLTEANRIISSAKFNNIQKAIDRRIAGQPIAQIIGHKEFYGLDFFVNREVLIPRPESELLIETALSILKTRRQPQKIIDLGTGSGALIIALAKNAPGHRYFASDVSTTALQVARRNLARYQLTKKIKLSQSDLFNNLPKIKFDLITANLPYVPEYYFSPDAPKSISWEPKIALIGGKDGLKIVRRLIKELPERLNHQGQALLEIGYNQGQAIRRLVKKYFSGAKVQIKKDLAGFDRGVIIKNF